MSDTYTSRDEEKSELIDESSKKRRRSLRLISMNKHQKIVNHAKKQYTYEEEKYFKSLSFNDKLRFSKTENNICKINSSNIPTRFKILNFDICDTLKSQAIRHIENIQSDESHSNNNNKMKQWIDTFIKIPFGKYSDIGINKECTFKEKSDFIKNVINNLDKEIHGHADAKDQIIRLIAQWVSNKNSKGMAIGIHGPMGCGKTSFVKSVCKSLNLPCGFIQLGGISDGSYLEGHGYTYEGSRQGKIVDVLIKTKCMNPVIFFDELDKVSTTQKGEEITNMLIHLVDFIQNDKYSDKYFSDIEIDLSRCLFIFSYNDETMINPILKDRLVTIQTNGYNMKDKIAIASNYMIPEILADFNIDNIKFSDIIIEEIVNIIDNEKGVRNLKRAIVDIISNINLQNILESRDVEGHRIVTSLDVKKYVKKNDKVPNNMMYL